MCAIEPETEVGVCPCSGWEDCDHHACCESRPENGEFWCSECWARDCYDHNIRDMVEMLAHFESEGRSRTELKPMINFIENWRGKFGKSQD